MDTELVLGDVSVDVLFKDIRNVHLSVHPPTGRVRLAAPARTSLDTLRAFAITKLGWIKQQQRRLNEQERETPREYLPRESHFVWGQRYLLTINEQAGSPMVELGQRHLIMHVRPGTTVSTMAQVLDAFYRDEVRNMATELMTTWSRTLGVRPGRLFIQRMRTRWGSCNPVTGAIRINSELAKKPSECLEYILVHELTHLIEPRHNDTFKNIISMHLPTWRHRRDMLNRLPIRHSDWNY